MKWVSETAGLLIKSWCADVEAGAHEQALNLAMLPFAYRHIALMPDCHQGYGMPIGGVLATEGVVIPNAVGVDIGCGMCAVRFNIKAEEIQKDDMKKIMGIIRKNVPVGFAKHPDMRNKMMMPRDSGESLIVDKEWNNAVMSMGSLGSGNHFIELQRSEKDGALWAMIHSGSRNLGKKVADHYNEIAKRLNDVWYSSVPAKHDLAFLPYMSEEGIAYVHEMQYCVEFALANRLEMMHQIIEAAHEVTGCEAVGNVINIAHNYARLEHHFGRDVVVHRKGATSAREGEIGLIPGSQGTASYVVRGLGNMESFMSCSHGAGRRIGRKAAQRELSLEGEIKRLDDLGVIHNVRNVADLDEAAGAYKDIDMVMEAQSDLVEIVEKLIPVAVIKG
jgi:tRNA-splicing ligase RtcB